MILNIVHHKSSASCISAAVLEPCWVLNIYTVTALKAFIKLILHWPLFKKPSSFILLIRKKCMS